MNEQDQIQIAREVVDAFGASNWERSSQLLSNTVYHELATQRHITGWDNILEVFKGWKQAMPDVFGTVTSAISSGNQVTLEITWEGTHTGPLVTPDGTIEASGKSQKTPAAWIFEFEGGNIKESRHYFDLLTFLQQIGAA